MPNLLQLKALRNKYIHQNDILSDKYLNDFSDSDLNLLMESFKYSSNNISDSFKYKQLNLNTKHFFPYFEQQKSADVVLTFIDITDFSIKCINKTNSELSKYLDNYYDKVIPIIYKHGGEIEKILGDGIIAVFGAPFLNDIKEVLFKKVDQCCKDIIMELKNTNMEVKAAIVDGNIMYYKNKSIEYPEYTIIGKPITELYRLESVSDNNAINYYGICDYDKKNFSNQNICFHSNKSILSHWKKSSLISTSLKGVSFNSRKKNECFSSINL